MSSTTPQTNTLTISSTLVLEPREIQQVTGATVVRTAADLTCLTIEPAPLRLMTLSRKSPWWFEPFHPQSFADVPRESAALCYQLSDTSFGVLLTLASGNKRAYLQGDAARLRLHVVGPRDGGLEPLLVHATGNSIDQAMTRAVIAAKEVLGTFKLTGEKARATWSDTLGWCTWDAFYQEVSHEKVVLGLNSLKTAGISPGFVILDDGWLDTDGDLLLSFDAHSKKFPNGLSQLIAQSKSEFGIQKFGVWHALQGYWSGVHPEGPLAKKYRILDVADTHFHGYNCRSSHGLRRGLVHPDDISRFFADWYQHLRAQGVDFTKVDNHASLESFGDEIVTRVNPTQTALAYQQGLQQAAATHFGGELLHCMCNSTEHLYRLQITNSWRNSDDFFPRQKGSHGFHLQTNAKNALLSSKIALCDWDMFQSHHETAQAHAAARVISGGPIYISDAPGNHNADLIRALTLSNSRVRTGAAGVVTHDRIFIDCLTQPRLLKIKRVEKPHSMLGVFHTQWVGPRGGENVVNHAGPITDTWKASDAFAGEAAEAVLAWRSFAKSFQVVAIDESNVLTLDPMSAELFTLTPIENGIAVIGLVDKLDPRAAVDSITRNTDGSIQVNLSDGGEFAYYSIKNGLVTTSLEPGKSHTVRIS